MSVNIINEFEFKNKTYLHIFDVSNDSTYLIDEDEKKLVEVTCDCYVKDLVNNKDIGKISMINTDKEQWEIECTINNANTNFTLRSPDKNRIPSDNLYQLELNIFKLYLEFN